LERLRTQDILSAVGDLCAEKHVPITHGRRCPA
jgi:hypothetical protein